MKFPPPSTATIHRLQTSDPLPKLVAFVVDDSRAAGAGCYKAVGANGLRVLKKICRSLPADLTGVYAKATDEPDGRVRTTSEMHTLWVRCADVAAGTQSGFYAPGVVAHDPGVTVFLNEASDVVKMIDLTNGEEV
jgi:hypothetical protein